MQNLSTHVYQVSSHRILLNSRQKPPSYCRTNEDTWVRVYLILLPNRPPRTFSFMSHSFDFFLGSPRFLVTFHPIFLSGKNPRFDDDRDNSWGCQPEKEIKKPLPAVFASRIGSRKEKGDVLGGLPFGCTRRRIGGDRMVYIRDELTSPEAWNNFVRLKAGVQRVNQLI